MHYLTVGDVGQLLERHSETIMSWLSEGRLPSLWMQEQLVVPMVAVWPRRQVSESDD